MRREDVIVMRLCGDEGRCVDLLRVLWAKKVIFFSPLWKEKGERHVKAGA